jgi:putative ABC transport system permease protein
MLTNYLKISLRALARNKVYSFINIFGLAVGMGVAMLIGLWVYDELTYNKVHPNYDRIAQVMEQQTLDGGIITGGNVAIPVGQELKDSYGDDFEQVVMSSWTTRHILTSGDNKIIRMGNFMSDGVPRMLSLNLIRGNDNALRDPASIMISESVAKALFGTTDPLGKLMKIDNELDVRVTGVYQDLPESSAFRDLKFIAPWDLFVTSNDWVKEARDRREWANSSFQIFAQIARHADLRAVSEKIKNIKIAKGDREELKFKPQILLHPMSRWHLYSEWENGVNAGGQIEVVWLFSIVGLFVLILACINFMNLSTASSQKRSKEVGIRKAIGSVRSQLVVQFFSESYLMVLSAFVFSLALVQVSLPVFNQIAGKEMSMLWSNPWFWIASTVFCLFTGLIAGSYPAFYLSSFRPIKALRGDVSGGLTGRHLHATPRRVLVVLQFTVSVALIIGTVIVYRQIRHGQNRPVGYDREGLVAVHMSTPDIHKHMEVVRDELLKSGSVVAITESQGPTTDIRSVNKGFVWKGKDPTLEVDFATIGIAHEYGQTVGWEFVEGRDFSRSFSADSSGIVLNETAAKLMGLAGKAPGESVRWNDRSFKVLGVVKDMVMTSPFEPVKQMIFFIARRAGNFVTVRINPKSNTGDALKHIGAVFKKYDPASPFAYEFVDEEYASKFAGEQRIGTLATFFASLAILISCLGLFGLAAFTSEQRTREIGIRKVLGASVVNLWLMLTRDFILLVMISCLIAGPLSWYLMNAWLQKYPYRAEMSWWIFAVTGFGAILITLFTVSFQAVKAALVNPVKSLKAE